MLQIQKLILLIDDSHFESFTGFLKHGEHKLPLALAENIRAGGLDQPETNELCRAVYGDVSEKSLKKFFQLAHHTLKLTSWLNHSRPLYLYDTIKIIIRELISGNRETARTYGIMLEEVAAKLEDFGTHMEVLKFLSSEAFMVEDKKKTVHYLDEVDRVLATLSAINDLHRYIRKNLHFKDKNEGEKTDMQAHLDYFSGYLEHQTHNVRFLARFGYLFTYEYFNSPIFFTESVMRDTEALIADIESADHLFLNFPIEMLLKLDTMYLKQQMRKGQEIEVERSTYDFIRKWEKKWIWKGYANVPMMMALSVEATNLVNQYYDTFKSEEDRELSSDYLLQLQYLEEITGRFLQSLNQQEGMHVLTITAATVKCAFMLLQSGQKAKEGAEMLEGVLFNFQQISFSKYYDSIFAALLLAYLSSHDHDKIKTSFKRFEKLTAEITRNEENYLAIKGIYYLSQFIETGRPQYARKFEEVQGEAISKPHLQATGQLLARMADYYHLKTVV